MVGGTATEEIRRRERLRFVFFLIVLPFIGVVGLFAGYLPTCQRLETALLSNHPDWVFT